MLYIIGNVMIVRIPQHPLQMKAWLDFRMLFGVRASCINELIVNQVKSTVYTFVIIIHVLHIWLFILMLFCSIFRLV
jgi:hypothetical protein